MFICSYSFNFFPKVCEIKPLISTYWLVCGLALYLFKTFRH